jgi:hypothetical protein
MSKKRILINDQLVYFEQIPCFVTEKEFGFYKDEYDRRLSSCIWIDRSKAKEMYASFRNLATSKSIKAVREIKVGFFDRLFGNYEQFIKVPLTKAEIANLAKKYNLNEDELQRLYHLFTEDLESRDITYY